jgi:hypothetical protein
MATRRKAGTDGSNGADAHADAPASVKPSTSVSLAQRGVQSSEDFRNIMCALMTDVIQGDVSPDVVNAACNAGRGLLRMVDMEYRASQGAANRSFPLSHRVTAGASA